MAQTRRMTRLRENLIAYAFLSPAMILLFLFGIFPVAFAFFVSLHRWRRFPGEYLGLDNFARGLSGFTYVIFFWIGVAVSLYALIQLRGLWQKRADRALVYVLPGVLNGAALILFIGWFTTALVPILNIPQRLRGQNLVQGIFVTELVASFQLPEVLAAWTPFLTVAVIALIASALTVAVVRGADRGAHLFKATTAAFLIGMGVLTIQLTLTEIGAASGDSLLPTQILMISVGAALLVAGYVLWTRGVRSHSNRRFVVLAAAALALMVGGVVFVAELPRLLAGGDPEVLHTFGITVMFALGTVPFQLAIGLALAYLLFQKIKGRSFFRLVYFLPYILPFVATSIVFNQIFSQRPASFANQVIGLFGIPDQKWLLEAQGIVELIFGSNVPAFLAGPSLALIVIMMYTVWTYIGYDTAVFLAGLGTISGELYEAARIDGASGWSIFRYITLPLLSPTTYFLSLIALIGTFQAFTQIWIMRTPASQSSVDTLSVYIFETARATDPNMGYGSALSFVLFGVILLLTLFQNRLAESRVFYG
ncbi:MAG: sugar ABC transporter permease [Anaerolineae bacterium]|nr:sugar ABC transporter permease [Anaerolineae bacterium]